MIRMRLRDSRAVVCLGMGEAGQGTARGTRKPFWDRTYVHYLDCGDGFTGYTYVKTYLTVHFK